VSGFIGAIGINSVGTVWAFLELDELRAMRCQMTSFVGENPIIMTGAVVAAGEADIVIGDGLGNTLTFRWSGAGEAQGHGSPSALIIDLPAMPSGGHFASKFDMHHEGRATGVVYVVEWVSDVIRVVTYTLYEDLRTLLVESQTPALARLDASEESRISTGSA
jgi:hypothetical protein